MDDDLTISIPVKADTRAFSAALDDLNTRSDRFASAITGALRSAVVQGKGFETTLKDIALRLSSVALSAGLKPLENLATGFFERAVSSFLPGGSGTGGGIVPFAKGGVVSAPSFFTAGGRMGVMGEAGAEAILPLARGSDGRLGVRSGGDAPAQNITVNISTPDVAGFKRSQSQVSAMLARTVGRGQRNL